MNKTPWIHYIRERGTNKPVGMIVAYDPDHIGYSYQHPDLDDWNYVQGFNCAKNRAFPNDKPAKIEKKTGKILRERKPGTKGGYLYNLNYILDRLDFYAAKSDFDSTCRYLHMLSIYKAITQMHQNILRAFERTKIANIEKDDYIVTLPEGYVIDEEQALKGIS